MLSNRCLLISMIPSKKALLNKNFNVGIAICYLGTLREINNTEFVKDHTYVVTQSN